MDSIVNLTKKFFAMIEILNQLILPKFVNNTSFKNYTVLYTGCPRTRGSNLQCVFLGDN
jgi:hypothetical protein